MGILEKISDIETEMAKTQKNKATEHHLGLLKSKLARYRVMLLEPPKTAAKVQGFEVTRQGDARVCLIGFPSVGKSTLLNTFTGGESSAAAAYEFTTLTCVPGKIHYKNAEVLIRTSHIVVDPAFRSARYNRGCLAG
jgi:ribosome-interacting GTPase 1